MILKRKAHNHSNPSDGVHSAMQKNVPGDVKMLWPSRLGVLLWVLVLIGYPLVSVSLAYMNLQSITLTYPYRTLVFFLALVIFFGAFRKRQHSRISVLTMIFFFIYTFRLLYDWIFADITGADRTLLYFLVVVLVPVVTIMFSGVNKLHDSIFAKPLLLGSLIVLILAIVAFRLGMGFNPWAEYGFQNNRLGFKTLNPISLGHVAGTTLICSFYLLHETHPGILLRVAAWSGVFLGGIVILLADSRGPIVATGFALAWFFLAHLKRTVYVIPLLLVLLLLVLPFFTLNDNTLIANVTERFSVDAGKDISGAGRLFAQKLAIQSFLENPVFGAHYIDPRLGMGGYPHNIIIETGMALGIFGLGIIFVMLIRSAKIVFSFYNVEHPLQVMLLAQYFVANQLSGALWGADAFFMLLVMCLTAQPPSGGKHNVSAIRRNIPSLLSRRSQTHTK